MSGLTIIRQPAEAESPGAWVTPIHLGRTADLSRVVDYYSPEAAFNFRSPGKKVTAEESERYGISAEHPFSPKPGDASSPTVPAPETKQADPPKDKAVTKAEIEDKSVRRSGKKAR